MPVSWVGRLRPWPRRSRLGCRRSRAWWYRSGPTSAPCPRPLLWWRRSGPASGRARSSPARRRPGRTGSIDRWRDASCPCRRWATTWPLPPPSRWSPARESGWPWRTISRWRRRWRCWCSRWSTVSAGVCFGMEPVTGRSDRLVAVVSAEGPEAVAERPGDGRAPPAHPGRQGHPARRRRRAAGVSPRRQCRGAGRRWSPTVGELFGGPQDVEFLFEPDGTLRLLQSRPVTTEVRGPPIGPVYGPGPVAETFPDPLLPLERVLWVDPLRAGLREALRLSALAGRARPRAVRPLVVVVDGRVAIDLELVGRDRRRRRWYRLDLRGRGRGPGRRGGSGASAPRCRRSPVTSCSTPTPSSTTSGPCIRSPTASWSGLLDRSRTLLLLAARPRDPDGVAGGRVATPASPGCRWPCARSSPAAATGSTTTRSSPAARSCSPSPVPGSTAVRLPRHVDDLGPPLPAEASATRRRCSARRCGCGSAGSRSSRFGPPACWGPDWRTGGGSPPPTRW